MQGYESVVILNPDLNDEEATGLLDKLKGVVTTQGGEVVRHTVWGRRKLAYEVEKKEYGNYHLLYLSHHPEALKALETQFRFEENVIKWLSVAVEDVDDEAVKFDKLVTEGSVSQTLTDR
jgi:small subunit ribosomal protein S6